jgi:hypothetical protein
LGVEKDVGGLQVPVDEAPHVNELHAVADLMIGRGKKKKKGTIGQGGGAAKKK